MGVKIQTAEVKTEKGEIIKFNVDDFTAVKGAEKSFFSGEIKAVHKVVAKRLIKSKLATEVKDVVLEKEVNEVRSTMDDSARNKKG